MITIDILPGTSIENAAVALVKNAPARATFNEVPIRARYATTQPRDIVAKYARDCEARAAAWRRSAAGKRFAAEQAERVRRAQDAADFGLALLPSLDFSDPASVLAWVETMIEPCDHVGVDWHKAETISAFVDRGWGVNVNCGEALNPDDARNVAGWIVGQWLNGYPRLHDFIADWRAKFGN